MSKMTKTLGILLAVCFLMSVTVASVSAHATGSTYGSQQMEKGSMNWEKGSSKGILVYIKNLVIAKDVAIFNDKSKLNVVVPKGMMGDKWDWGSKGMMAKSSGTSQPCPTRIAANPGSKLATNPGKSC